jgi:hypothetical protein
MHILESRRELAAPLHAVWELIEDFGHIERWWSREAPIQIEKVILEGQGIGQVRHIHWPGVAAPVSERLDYLDPAQGIWKLSIIGQRPAGLTRYQATGRLSALPGGGCRLDYKSEFMTQNGAPEEASAFLQVAYEWMYRGLEAAAKG